MNYQAQVLYLDENVEEEVTLQVDGVQLTCFASICPYAIEEGLSYPIQLQLIVFDNYDVQESVDEAAPAFTRTGSAFGYAVVGRLNGSRLEIGRLAFEDDVLQRDFGYLDGSIIVMKVDRIDVEFLDR